MKIFKVPGNLFKHIPTKYGELLIQHNYVGEDESPFKIDFVIEFEQEDLVGLRTTLSLAFSDEEKRNNLYDKLTSEHAEEMIENAYKILNPPEDENK